MLFLIRENLQTIYVVGGLFGVIVVFYIFFTKKKIILYPELIPYTMHYKNVRAVLSAKEWKDLAKTIYKKSGYKCDICGFRAALECHEVWDFNENKMVQKLVGLTTLCHRCHQVKHIGLAKKMGYYVNALTHMAKVNGISKRKAQKLVYYAEMEVKKRNVEYDLDLTFLNNYTDLLRRKFGRRENESCKEISGNY